MLTIVFIILLVAAIAANVLLLIRSQKQAASYRQLDSTHQQLTREHDDLKTRYQTVKAVRKRTTTKYYLGRWRSARNDEQS